MLVSQSCFEQLAANVAADSKARGAWRSQGPPSTLINLGEYVLLKDPSLPPVCLYQVGPASPAAPPFVSSAPPLPPAPYSLLGPSVTCLFTATRLV